MKLLSRRRKQYYLNRLAAAYPHGEPDIVLLGDLADDFFWEFHENPDEKYDELGMGYQGFRVEFLSDHLGISESAKKKKSKPE